MKKNLLLISFFLFFSISIFSQLKKTAIPNWVKTTSYSQKPNIKEDQITQGVLMLLLDTQINVKQQKNYYRKVYKTTDNVGVQNSSTINVEFDPNYQKVSFHHITIYRKGKKLEKLKIKDFQLIRKETNSENFIYDGSLSATFNIPDVRPDDIIDYSYTITGYNPIHNNIFSTSIYLNDYFPIGKISTLIISPKELNYKSVNTTIKPTIKKKNGLFNYTWQNQNTESVTIEDNTPASNFIYAHVFITEYNSWQEVVNWGVNVFNIKNSLSKELRKKINQINKNNKTEGEKINATLNFVQDQIRYLGLESGIGSYKPFSPKKVFEQRFGDCKDKSLLMVTMLNEMGIEAYPTLVNTFLTKSVKQLLPSPKYFDHCVVKVIDNKGNSYWYDPTISNQGGQYDTTYFPNYSRGLVLKKDTEDFDFITTFASNRVDVTETYVLNEIGKGAELKVTTIYYDNEADTMRSFFKKNSINTVKKEYEKYYGNYYPGIELSYDPTYSDNIEENEFTVTEQYIIDNIWTKDSSNGKMSINFQPTTLLEIITFPNKKSRKNEYALYYPSTRRQKTYIHLPDNWLVNNDRKTVDGPGFKYDYSVVYNSNQRIITIDHYIEFKKSEISSEEYPLYLDKIKEVENSLTYNIFTFGDNVKQSSNILNIIGQLLFYISLIVAFWIAFKIYKYNPETKIESYYEENKAIGGWLILIAIGLCATPIRILFDLYLNEPIFTNGSWITFLDSKSSNYNLVLGLLIFIELVFNTFLLALIFLSIVLFFTKRNTFPKVYSFLLIGSLIFVVIDSLLVSYISDTSMSTREINEIGVMFIRVSLIAAYLLFSERAKETFVNRLKS